MTQTVGVQLPADLGSRLAIHSFAAVILGVCVVLLLRTSSGTLYSRFLRHLSISVGLNVLFRLGSVLDLLSRAVASYLQPRVAAGESMAVSVVAVTVKLQAIWTVADSLISLLASFFLFAAWGILRNYPREGVGRRMYTQLTIGFAVSLLAVLANFIEVIDSSIVRAHWSGLLTFLDISAATIALLLVGWQLNHTLGPHVQTKSLILRRAVPTATMLIYFVWAGFQPLYPWFGKELMYEIGILLTGVAAIVMTLLLCAESLEDRPQYDTRPALPDQEPMHSI